MRMDSDPVGRLRDGRYKSLNALCKSDEFTGFVQESVFLGFPFSRQEIKVHSVEQFIFITFRNHYCRDLKEQVPQRNGPIQKEFSRIELVAFAQGNSCFNGKFSAARPSQANEVGPAAIIFSDIVCKAPGVCPCAAGKLKLDFAIAHLEKGKRFDRDGLGGWGYIDAFARVGV